MNRKTALLVVLTALVIPLPMIQAVPPDTPATFVCQFTFSARAGLTSSLQAVDFSRTGKILLSGFDGVDTEDRMVVADQSCNTVWSLTSSSPGITFSGYDQAAFDGADRVIADHFKGDGAGNDERTLRLLSSTTGATLQETENLLVTFGAAYDTFDVDDLRVNSTSADYFVSHQNGMVSRYNDADLSRDFSVANTAVTVRSGEATGVLYARSSGNNYLRINATTGATLHTSAVSTGVSKPPIRGELNTSVVYQAVGTGNSMSYHRLLASDFTSVNENVVITDNRIDIGGGPLATTVGGFDVDGQDNLLLCGNVTGRSFATKISTSSNTQRWNVTTTELGGSRCGFDYQGGFWIAGVGTSGGTGYYWARRYIGGEFATPSTPGSVIPGGAGDGDGDTDADNPLSNAVNFFNDAWGFDGSFLFGTVIVGMFTIGFARVSRNAMITAIGAFLGVVTAYVLDLYPVWLLLLIVFLIIAIAGSVMFNRGGGSEE